MKTRIFSFLLAVCMVAGMLTACGTSDSGEPTDTTDGQTDTTAESTEAERGLSFADLEYLNSFGERDFDGASFVYLIPRIGDKALNPPGEEMTGEPLPDTQFTRDRILESMYGITIEYPLYSNFTDTLSNAVRAGDTIGDVYADGLNDGNSGMSLLKSVSALSVRWKMISSFFLYPNTMRNRKATTPTSTLGQNRFWRFLLW